MNTHYKVRSVILLFLFYAAYIVIAIHLYFIQIIQNNFYLDLGNQQYKIQLTVTPERGIIYDRNGTPLTINKDSFSAFLIPRNLLSSNQTITFLDQYFPQASKRLQENKNANFLYIKRRLTDQEITLIKQSGLEDIKILKEPGRFYTAAPMSTIVGMTDVDNKGLFGIELLYNDQLTGSPSAVFLEKDARSGLFHFKKETKTEGHSGSAITLTIDADLQFLVHEELKETIMQLQAEDGAAIILNPHNGQILAMASLPDFDANNTQHLILGYTKNRCLSDTHEFGSVMKTFVALALLEEQLVTPDELINCENTKTTFIQGIKVSTWKEHGYLSFSEIIQKSNNIGTVKAALRLGRLLYDHYIRLGFGKKILQWPGEQTGYVNPPHKWSKLSLATLSFGYEITATLLQLAQAFSIITNGGYSIYPHIVLHQKLPVPVQLYSSIAIEQLNNILENTVTQGTAYQAKLNGYTVRGKTGTANMLVNGQYSRAHNVYCFVGSVTKGNYQRVIAVFVTIANQEKLYASSVAVPLFERIANLLLIHEKIM